MARRIRRIGVLTGGGDCPGLNAVLRAVVKTCSHSDPVQVCGIRNGFDGLVLGATPRPLGPDQVRGLLPRGGTILGTTNRGNPFRYPVQRAGKVQLIDASGKVLAHLKRSRLEGLIVIGGDGSLSIASELSQLGAQIVGVPKTIDNDLMGTDSTFGFDTAVATATEAIDRLHTTAESHHRVMILELMGRDAGWIALSAGLAGGADVILIPEIPFRLESVVQAIDRRRKKGRMFSIVVAAEGARFQGQKKIYQGPPAPGALPRLGGIGSLLERRLSQATQLEVRTTVLGHLQRGGSPTPNDRILASRFGAEAARLAIAKSYGRMVCLRGRSVTSIPLAEAVSQIRRVDPGGELVRAARDLGIGFGD
ncbi:MAG TPA: ATP-dependent 6-phosphofructokinase [Acidobacteriota bacterium]